MEHLRNNENQNPKSHRRIGYKTSFKNNIQFKNKPSSQNQKLAPRTPLKSKINLMQPNQQPSDAKDYKCLQYPLLKSTSYSNINNNKSYNNNFNLLNKDIEEKYNENAFEDEVEDFMHMNENEIFIHNEEEDENLLSLKKQKLNVEIMNNINPLPNNGNNYILAAHFDDNGKKEYDDYFDCPDKNDLNDYDCDI